MINGISTPQSCFLTPRVSNLSFLFIYEDLVFLAFANMWFEQIGHAEKMMPQLRLMVWRIKERTRQR